MNEPGPILMFGHDAALLDSRRWVLETANLFSTGVTTLSALIGALADPHWELLILCHSLPVAKGKTACSMVALYAPGTETLVLEAGRGTSGLVSDHFFDILSGPKRLISEVQSLLSPAPGSFTESDRRVQTYHRAVAVPGAFAQQRTPFVPATRRRALTFVYDGVGRPKEAIKRQAER